MQHMWPSQLNSIKHWHHIFTSCCSVHRNFLLPYILLTNVPPLVFAYLVSTSVWRLIWICICQYSTALNSMFLNSIVSFDFPFHSGINKHSSSRVHKARQMGLCSTTGLFGKSVTNIWNGTFAQTSCTPRLWRFYFVCLPTCIRSVVIRIRVDVPTTTSGSKLNIAVMRLAT